MQLDTETDNTAQAELLSLTLVLSSTHPSGTSVHSTSTHAPVCTHQVPIHQCALNKYSCTSVHSTSIHAPVCTYQIDYEIIKGKNTGKKKNKKKMKFEIISQVG